MRRYQLQIWKVQVHKTQVNGWRLKPYFSPMEAGIDLFNPLSEKVHGKRHGLAQHLLHEAEYAALLMGLEFCVQ